MSLFCLLSLIAHYSHICLGDACLQHSQLDSVLPAVVMAAEELGQWTWEVSIVIIIIIIMNILYIIRSLSGTQSAAPPRYECPDHLMLVTPGHLSGSSARCGDVL